MESAAVAPSASARSKGLSSQKKAMRSLTGGRLRPAMAGRTHSNRAPSVIAEERTPTIAAAALSGAQPLSAKSKTAKKDSAFVKKRARADQDEARLLVAAPKDQDSDPTARIEHNSAAKPAKRPRASAGAGGVGNERPSKKPSSAPAAPAAQETSTEKKVRTPCCASPANESLAARARPSFLSLKRVCLIVCLKTSHTTQGKVSSAAFHSNEVSWLCHCPFQESPALDHGCFNPNSIHCNLWLQGVKITIEDRGERTEGYLFDPDHITAAIAVKCNAKGLALKPNAISIQSTKKSNTGPFLMVPPAD